MNVFWTQIEQLVAGSRVVIDRPKGSAHPTAPGCFYPVDYGFLEGTRSADGEGIDVWLGSAPGVGLVGAICTVDLPKREMELKLLIDCTENEITMVQRFFAQLTMGHATIIRRPTEAED